MSCSAFFCGRLPRLHPSEQAARRARRLVAGRWPSRRPVARLKGGPAVPRLESRLTSEAAVGGLPSRRRPRLPLAPLAPRRLLPLSPEAPRRLLLLLSPIPGAQRQPQPPHLSDLSRYTM
eukprot:scaffold4058_cov121-Isochrysis_galbana.AAC.3